MTVIISASAEAELEVIFAYGANTWGLAQAQRYTDRLIDAFDRIAAHEVFWRPIDATVGVDGYRYTCGRHIIYWRSSGEQVTILAILHDRMDQARRLQGYTD